MTARRREEALADVPVAVAVMNAATLETRGIHTEADLQLAMPGVIVRSSNNNNQLNYVIRGESVDAYSGSPPGVQPYINEVPFPVMSSDAVLRSRQRAGGQGAARHAVRPQLDRRCGAVSDGDAEPTTSAAMRTVQYGNYDRLITEAAVDVPVIADKLLVRFAGTVTSGGAYVRNLYDNQSSATRTSDRAASRSTCVRSNTDQRHDRPDRRNDAARTRRTRRTTRFRAATFGIQLLHLFAGESAVLQRPAERGALSGLSRRASSIRRFRVAAGVPALARRIRRRTRTPLFDHDANSDMVVNKTDV